MGKEFLEECLAKGLSLEAIGLKVGKHRSTVNYWVNKHGLKAVNWRDPRRRRRDGAKIAHFECRHHGLTEFTLEGRGHYRCKRCRSEAVARRRRAIKRQLVEDAGGACVLCGYDNWLGALQFHHVDPSLKKFQLGQQGHTRSLARCRAEARKCVLLCANCHAEVEGGFATLPKDLWLDREEVSG